MTYTQQGERVTLEMTHDELLTLIGALGAATAAEIKAGNRTQSSRSIAFANKLNNGNPTWTLYEIPEEFRG